MEQTPIKKSHKKKPAAAAPAETVTIGGIANPTEQASFPGMEPPPKPEREEYPKLVIPMLPNGAFHLEGMRESTQQKLFAATALLPKPEVVAPMSIPDGVVAGIYAILGAAESALAQRTGIPAKDANAIFKYGAADLEMLSEPTKKVLAKHAGSLNRFPEETELLLALAAVHMSKLQALQQVRADRSLEEIIKPESRDGE